jgi:hypothetical protein
MPEALGGVTVVIGGDDRPSSTPPIFVSPVPRATPPQFEQTPRSVVLTGTASPIAPPAMTPPLYSGGPIVDAPNTIRLSGEPAATSAFSSGELPKTESAWNWQSPSSNSANPLEPPEDAPVASPPSPPSPGFAPQTAWDAKSSPGISLGNVVGEGRALELVGTDLPVVSSPSTQSARLAADVRSLVRGARDLLDLDDHTGAVDLIMKAQAIAPDDAEVQQLRDRSERTLLAMFESKLGNMNAVPRVLLKDDEIIWLNLDHRAGFVLAQIDGTVSFDDVFAVSGMSRLDTARIIAQLIDEGVISRG